MSASVQQGVSSRRIRVAIIAEDFERRTALRALLEDAGHEVVEASGEVDVAIIEGDAQRVDSSSSVAAILLGSSEADGAESRVQGLLDHDATAEQIDAAVRAVVAGLWVSAEAQSKSGFGEARVSGARILLTPRELEILAAIGQGMSNKSIARQFQISLHTVKFHIESLFRKLGARSRAEAVAKGMAHSRAETIEM